MEMEEKIIIPTVDQEEIEKLKMLTETEWRKVLKTVKEKADQTDDIISVYRTGVNEIMFETAAGPVLCDMRKNPENSKFFFILKNREEEASNNVRVIH